MKTQLEGTIIGGAKIEYGATYTVDGATHTGAQILGAYHSGGYPRVTSEVCSCCLGDGGNGAGGYSACCGAPVEDGHQPIILPVV